MSNAVEIVGKYISAFRGLINSKIWPSKYSIRKTLRLIKDEDWSFLCVSMDIIEDACTAIDNFLKFGLNGPTKYEDVGEKYLRLYGILSATYIQQEALLKLYQIVNVPPSLKKGKELVNKLSIRSLRHKLSSHGTNYFNEDSKSVQAYVPIRFDLNNFNCTYAKNGRGNHNSVDLKEAVNEHLNTMIELLDRILEKALKTLFKGQETNKDCIEFSGELADLRIIRKGGFVLRPPTRAAAEAPRNWWAGISPMSSLRAAWAASRAWRTAARPAACSGLTRSMFSITWGSNPRSAGEQGKAGARPPHPSGRRPRPQNSRRAPARRPTNAAG